MERIKVLDKGFVQLVDMMGDDYRILESARISTGSVPTKGDEKDRSLIRHLYRNQHMSPFEQVVLTFRIKMPIFVMRQWVRHRTQSLNEISGRYTKLENEYYCPEEWRKQSIINHQGSSDNFEESDNIQLSQFYKTVMFPPYNFYDKTNKEYGVANEMSRMTVPVAQYTEFYTTINLRNLFHLLELRLDGHAQYEIRVYAEAILNILKNEEKLKWTIEIFQEEFELNQIILKLKEKYKTNYSELKSKLQTIGE